MNLARPTFLGIGAQKAGTSWLYRQLSGHPDIWMPPVKELHYFDRSDRYASPNVLQTSSPIARMLGSRPWQRRRMLSELKPLVGSLVTGNFREAAWWRAWTFGSYDESWYRKLFAQASPNQACGEITPSYSILEEEDISQIKAVNPDIKLIFMIRNPIERAWSAVRFNANRPKLKSKINLDSDEQIIAILKKPGVEARGDYERTLEAYLNHFQSDQILIGFYDAIEQDPWGLMSGITEFLGISACPEDSIDSQTRVNASPARELQGKVSDYLLETYAPVTRRLAERFGSYAQTWLSCLEEDDSARNPTNAPRRPVCHP